MEVFLPLLGPQHGLRMEENTISKVSLAKNEN